MPPPERSLYLYYLDRELGEAVEFCLDPIVARHAVQTLVVGTNARLICGLSLLYENNNLDRSTVDFFRSLLEVGVLDTISHYLTYDEFKASRIAMYAHDSSRYPAYFGKSILPAIAPTVQKVGGTTRHIIAGMSEWALQIHSEDPRLRLISAQLSNPVLLALQQREERAVTYSLFSPFLGQLADSPVAQGHIRRAISRFFAGDYRDFGDNDIPTGIRGLGYFEQELARDFPLYDIKILSRILQLVGLGDTLAVDWADATWMAALLARESYGHTLLASSIRWIMSAMVDALPLQYSDLRQDEVRLRLVATLNAVVSRRPVPSSGISGDDLYAIATSNIAAIAQDLRRIPRLAEALDRLHDDFLPPPQADVLIVVATEVESEAVFKTFSSEGYKPVQPWFSSTNAYQLFTPIGGARVALVRCSMGPGGPGGPELTVAEAITALKPTSVVMLGIAFGVKPEAQKIGDVLISTQVFDYNLERIGTDIAGRLVRTSRGARPDASPGLIARFQMARLHTHGLTVHEGTILSGSKLIDNLDYRDQISSLCRDAIGGEMEAFGVYSAAARAHVDWIIVKAVCDWADGHKRARKAYRQGLAAQNAALAVLRTIERGGF